MEEPKKLGIWMCHSSIHLVEYAPLQAPIVPDKQQNEVHNMETNNATIQNEAFHLQTESFKKLGVAIEKYQEVLLFGPVDVKLEFMKFLNSDSRFNNIKIEVKQTHPLNEAEQQLFVEDHFS